MAALPIPLHPTQCNAISDDLPYLPKPAANHVSPPDVKKAEELDFDKTDLVPMFKKKSNKVHMGVGITKNTLGPTLSVSDIATGQNLVHTSFIPIKWSDCVLPAHKMSLKSTSNNPINVIGKVMPFV